MYDIYHSVMHFRVSETMLKIWSVIYISCQVATVTAAVCSKVVITMFLIHCMLLVP